MNKIYAVAFLPVLACNAFAEEDKKLVAELEVGVIATSGNTETQSYKSKLDVKHDLISWRNHYILEGLYKRDKVDVDDGTGSITQENRTTAEKYFASAQGDYVLDKEHAALFIYGEYDKNRFSGFDYQYTVALGYSNRLFTHDNSYLAYNIGPGMTSDKPEDIDGVDQDSEETFIVRMSGEYVYEFSDNAKFTQTLSTNYATKDDRNTKTKSVSSVTAQLMSSLALRASYTVDYNSEAPVGRKHADTETSLTVVYNF
ncbi:MAG: DUF481 domain-containing protein [Agarilytica sp.]